MAPLLKICGLTQPAQAAAIAGLGVEAIGVIGVPGSPRHLAAAQRPALFAAAAAANPRCVGVLVAADPSDAELEQLGGRGGHRVLQLHGAESPERCAELRRRLDVQLWKALRVRSAADLEHADRYAAVVDALLLDAWVPDQLGGTGQAIPLEWLQGFRSPLPWWLAGGLSAERVAPVLAALQPTGLDASSWVELAPGVKDLNRVVALLEAVRRWR
jgi:phosphoribosylanthranilate isomerase